MALVPEFKAFIWLIICGWVLFMIFVILAPLLFFSPPMLRTRDKAMIEYGRLAQGHHQAFRETWINGNRRSGQLLGSPDPSSAADLNDIVQTALGMRIVPLDLAAFLQILIAAVVPFIAVVVSLIPLAELLKWLVGAIF